jgi:hypothetical protein
VNIQLATTPVASIATSSPYLQRVLEELVHLGDLGRDGKVDGAVTNLNNEAATDLRVDLRARIKLAKCPNLPDCVLFSFA